jgi:hypothetical protein
MVGGRTVVALVVIATSLVHVVTLIASRKLREHWLHLLPRRNDIGEAAGGFAYNVGLRRTPPRISSHSYIEKIEYWAVVWGTVMMGVSGVLLWADNFVLSYFPKGILDVAGVFHYYEAILAALAILVWHFYSVIFDPNVYPMNFAWLTGYGPGRSSDAASASASVKESFGRDTQPGAAPKDGVPGSGSGPDAGGAHPADTDSIDSDSADADSGKEAR